MLKQNIAIVSLDNIEGKKTAERLAQTLEMFFVDIEDLLAYNLVDKAMLKSAGKDYFQKQEKKVIEEISRYQNVMIFCELDLLNKSDYIEIIKSNSTLIYFRYKKDSIKKLKSAYNTGTAFQEEDKFCQAISDLTIDIKQKSNIQDIMKELKIYFNKELKA